MICFFHLALKCVIIILDWAMQRLRLSKRILKNRLLWYSLSVKMLKKMKIHQNRATILILSKQSKTRELSTLFLLTNCKASRQCELNQHHHCGTDYNYYHYWICFVILCYAFPFQIMQLLRHGMTVSHICLSFSSSKKRCRLLLEKEILHIKDYCRTFMTF